MREAVKGLNHPPMAFGIVEEAGVLAAHRSRCLIDQAGKQGHAHVLQREVLRVLQRQVEEHPLRTRQLAVVAKTQAFQC